MRTVGLQRGPYLRPIFFTHGEDQAPPKVLETAVASRLLRNRMTLVIAASRRGFFRDPWMLLGELLGRRVV